MTPEELAANNARQLLENERFKQAFTNVRENIVRSLEGLSIGNDQARIELVISLQVLKAVQNDIENDIKTGLLESY